MSKEESSGGKVLNFPAWLDLERETVLLVSEKKIVSSVDKILQFPAWLGLEMVCQVCKAEIILSSKDMDRVEKKDGEFGHSVTCENCGTDIHFC